MNKLLKKIAEHRQRLMSMGRGRQDCTYDELNAVINASNFTKENAEKWLKRNKHVAYKVCSARLKNERQIIINL